VKITLNGKDIDIKENSTITDMLTEMNHLSKMIVVELNLNIILKENYAKTTLNEGDSIEIVSFAGGG
jgi:sulfur carrier protein